MGTNDRAQNTLTSVLFQASLRSLQLHTCLSFLGSPMGTWCGQTVPSIKVMHTFFSSKVTLCTFSFKKKNKGQCKSSRHYFLKKYLPTTYPHDGFKVFHIIVIPKCQRYSGLCHYSPGTSFFGAILKYMQLLYSTLGVSVIFWNHWCCICHRNMRTQGRNIGSWKWILSHNVHWTPQQFGLCLLDVLFTQTG